MFALATRMVRHALFGPLGSYLIDSFRKAIASSRWSALAGWCAFGSRDEILFKTGV